MRCVRPVGSAQNLLKIFLKTDSENITKYIFSKRENGRGYWKVMKHLGFHTQMAFKRSPVRSRLPPPRYLQGSRPFRSGAFFYRLPRQIPRKNKICILRLMPNGGLGDYSRRPAFFATAINGGSMIIFKQSPRLLLILP